MRHFEYFLFENFDAEQEENHPGNPRRILNRQTDAILSRTADFPPHACPSSLLRKEFDAEAVNRLIGSGALRETEGALLYDTPIFLEEDAPALDPLAQTLLAAPRQLGLTAVRHGVAPGEIANELYHILFGGINEALVNLGLVTPPPYRSSEGRFGSVSNGRALQQTLRRIRTSRADISQ